MKKIHITLVGAQPAPIYHAIVAIQPDKIIYVYSESSKSTLDVLKENIDIDSDEIKLDPTSPTQIKLCAERLRDIYKNHIVTVNITSGLKSWSHWFGVTFQNPTSTTYTPTPIKKFLKMLGVKFKDQSNATVIYIDQNNVLWNYNTLEPLRDIVNFDMRRVIKLHGNELVNYTRYTDYTQQDFDAASKVERIRKHHFKVFNRLTIELSKEEINKLKTDKDCSICSNFDSGKNGKLEYNKDLNRVELEIYSKTHPEKHTIEAPHIKNIVFFAGWFELKVAKLLSTWVHTKEICMNCRFPFKQGLDKNDKNEVDIIINTGTKILFVECKTQIYDTTAIDKFRSVIKTYGGTASKGLFVTDAKMSDIARAKCKEHRILTYSFQDEHDGKSHKEAIADLLNRELYNINTK